MIPSDDVLAGLPAPLDDEPPSVRQDIADELADHLACAYRRELLKTADEPTAQQRVLDRFGDPRRIAYQLWFQALWGRIMLHRFTRVWQGLKIVCGLVALFLIVRMAEQQSALHSQIQFMTANYNAMQSQTMGTRNLLEQVLQRLPQPPQKPGYENGMGGAEGMTMPGNGAMMGMGTGPMMPGSEMGMAPGMMPGAASVPTSSSSDDVYTNQHGLAVRLTMQGTDNKPASGCLVAVSDEQGNDLELLPYSTGSGASPMTGFAGFMGLPAASGMPSSSSSGQKMRQTGRVGHLLTSNMNGLLHFGQKFAGRNEAVIVPGRYYIYVEFPDGRQTWRGIVVQPNSKQTSQIQIQCPQLDQKAYVTFHTPKLPKILSDAGIAAVASLKHDPTANVTSIGWTTESLSQGLYLEFDPNMGTTLRYGPPHSAFAEGLSGFYAPRWPIARLSTDFSRLAPEDRFLAILEGEYDVQLAWLNTKTGTLIGADSAQAKPSTSITFPAAGAAHTGRLTINTNTRDVLLDFPDHMLEVALKNIDRPRDHETAIGTERNDASTDAEFKPRSTTPPSPQSDTLKP